MENPIGVLFFAGGAVFSGFLIGRLQAYMVIWLFFVPVRHKLPMFFKASLGALPWFAGFLIPMFLVAEGQRYGLEELEGKLLALSAVAFLIGLHVVANRWDRALQAGDWMTERGARNAMIWAGSVALCAGGFVAYAALSAPL